MYSCIISTLLLLLRHSDPEEPGLHQRIKDLEDVSVEIITSPV